MRNQADIERIADIRRNLAEIEQVRGDMRSVIRHMRGERLKRQLQGPPKPSGSVVYPRSPISVLDGLHSLRDRCYAKMRGMPTPRN